MVHLKNAKVFDNIKAIIWGDFTNSNENLEAAIQDFCLSHIPTIPTYKVQGIGHGKINHPFILGSSATILDEYFIQKSDFRLK